ncbi:hypothetical protein [Armatimonas sp.]|uniref:hypothetical protein n=1 Tax=Armatimonas sp. TaxID=1872638 RepID=UPI003753E646
MMLKPKPIPQLATWEARTTNCAKIIAAQPGAASGALGEPSQPRRGHGDASLASASAFW